MLIKGLEYLAQVFQMLVEMEYMMAENEGSSFVPHLLLKVTIFISQYVATFQFLTCHISSQIGDPKDAVRNGVRRVLRQINLLYPFTKVFSYVMEGLKSKNARQRTECLDELTFLIENYGLGICQPSQQVALKEIARQISDRDNSVRNAALNCIVMAYFLAGEKIYKLIGQLNEKDLSMLDERIKRAKKTRKPAVPAEMPPGLKPPTQVVQQDSIEIEDAVGNGCEELPPPEEEG